MFFYKERKRTQRTKHSSIKSAKKRKKIAFFWKERMPNPGAGPQKMLTVTLKWANNLFKQTFLNLRQGEMSSLGLLEAKNEEKLKKNDYFLPILEAQTKFIFLNFEFSSWRLFCEVIWRYLQMFRENVKVQNSASFLESQKVLNHSIQVTMIVVLLLVIT